MDTPRPLLAFGHFSRPARAQLEVAATESGYALSLLDDADSAADYLDKHQPHAILVDADADASEQVALAARGHAHNARVPILALTASAVSDLVFGDAFSWGGDDALSLQTPRSLVRRLRSLPKEAPQPPTNGRGTALVAEPDHRRRIVLGRVLRNAGYSVSFGVDQRDLRRLGDGAAPDLAVVSSEVPGVATSLVSQLREDGVDSTVIISAAPRDLRAWSDALVGQDRAAVLDGFASPENVLFLANDLANATRANQRASARLLYGTSVAFRGAGRDQDDHGFSYNVSAGGLYVRTLAPPEDDTVWIEISPPRTERRVRLVGSVVWRRGLQHSETATVPPGFGVKITDGAKADLEAWESGYSAFHQAIG